MIVLWWLVAYAASMWLFPLAQALTATTVNGEEVHRVQLMGQLFQYVFFATPSRVVAYPLMTLALLPVWLLPRI